MNITQAQYREFFKLAYARLAVRGIVRERDISDPILRKVWRIGKRLSKTRRPRAK